MKHQRYVYHHAHFPFRHFLFGLLLLALFGWKLFFFFPLLFILPFLLFPLMGGWYGPEPRDPWYEDGEWRDVWYGTEKRKRKPKNDDWDEPDFV